MSSYNSGKHLIDSKLSSLITELGEVVGLSKVSDCGNRPNLLLRMKGLRVAIETKFNSDTNAKSEVFEAACRCVRTNIAHIAIAVLYSTDVKSASPGALAGLLAKSKLDYCVISESFAEPTWSTGTLESMLTAVRLVQENLVKDDIVEKTAKRLQIQLESLASHWIDNEEFCDELSNLLDMGIQKNENKSAVGERRMTAAKVTALVLANALIFQEKLSKSDKRIATLKDMYKSGELISVTSAHWQWITDNVNFESIFELGKKILDMLPEAGSNDSSLKSLLIEAEKICEEQTTLRHDLMGRIYHWLLNDAKYLGTYFTSVSAATLLSKIVMNLDWEADFGHPRRIADFKVADLASGTGTLLMSTTQAITDAFISTRVHNDESIDESDLSTLHKALMENCIHGYDILPTAVHLTASTLALLAPDVAYRKMNLFVMPIGVDHGTVKLGSLDFLISNHIHTQLTLDNTHLETIQKGVDASTSINANVPKVDLCIMNPPFVRSGGSNLLFGSHPEHRNKMQNELKLRAKQVDVSITPGLGAIFIPLADKCLKPGGRMAFILPIALASGKEWGSVRKYISDRYHLEVVITSHESGRTNFSENTALSELMFIARKLTKGETAGKTSYVTLLANPTSIHDALNTGSLVSDAIKASTKSSNPVILNSSEGILGEVATLPSPLDDENWTTAIFSQSKLAQIYLDLERNSSLVLPDCNQECQIPMCSIHDIGELGYDNRDVLDAFDVDKTMTQKTDYLGFWNHDSKMVTQIAQMPNAYLEPRTEALEGRKIKDHNAIWKKASNIMLVAKVRTNTHRLLATYFNVDVVGNTWWTFKGNDLSVAENKALLLWLNSSLGIVMIYGRRAITEGAWMKLNKQSWEKIQVLDIRKLSNAQLNSLEKSYDKLATKELKPLALTHEDRIRNQIDETICSALDIPKLESIRKLLAREPGITG